MQCIECYSVVLIESEPIEFFLSVIVLFLSLIHIYDYGVARGGDIFNLAGEFINSYEFVAQALSLIHI